MARERSLAETEPQVDLGEILGNLANNMREYDRLVAERAELTNERELQRPLLEGVNPDLGAHAQQYFAIPALHTIIIEKRITRIDASLESLKDLQRQEENALYEGKILGKKVRVESVNPNKYKLETSLKGLHSDLIYLGKSYDSREGKIDGFGLELSEGPYNYLRVNGRGGKVYEGFPLIDRNNDYEPAFQITFL